MEHPVASRSRGEVRGGSNRKFWSAGREKKKKNVLLVAARRRRHARRALAARTVRPAVCLVCGASSFANLKPGVTRLREELEAAAGRSVVAVTGKDDDAPAAAGVYVGTEAVLHRVARADVVAFLDIDLELLAPRYRAAEQTMALLVRAARLVGPRAGGGRLLVQTFLPRHEVVQAALHADPGRLVEPERARRRLLGLPPFAALAAVSGSGSEAVAESLRAVEGISVGGSDGSYTARAAALGRPRPGPRRRPPPQGLPHPPRRRPTPRVSDRFPQLLTQTTTNWSSAVNSSGNT